MKTENKKYKFEGRHKLRPFTVLYVDEECIYCLTHTHSKNIGKFKNNKKSFNKNAETGI